MTQAERVLRALKNAGPAGLTQVDFLAPAVVDGGKPITRLAARIMELREQGHVIARDGTRNECAVYRLEGRQSQVLDAGGLPLLAEFRARDELVEPVSMWQEPAVGTGTPYDRYGEAA